VVVVIAHFCRADAAAQNLAYGALCAPGAPVRRSGRTAFRVQDDRPDASGAVCMLALRGHSRSNVSGETETAKAWFHDGRRIVRIRAHRDQDRAHAAER